MAVQEKARKITIYFNGGSATAPRGLWEALFDGDLGLLGLLGDDKTVSVTGHTRQRIIGGPTTAVGGHSYTRKAIKRGKRGGAAGGEPITISCNGSDWTARLYGSHQDFCKFWETFQFPLNQDVVWRSEKGTPYGPYKN